MKKIYKSRFVKILLFLLLVTVSSVYAANEKAITKKEAVETAKDYVLKNDLQKNVILFLPKVTESTLVDNCWNVYYYPSPMVMFRLPFTFSVHINKKTGKIDATGWNK